MKRPKQVPAVDRNSSKTAAVPAGARGVGPSFDWGSLIPIGQSLFGYPLAVSARRWAAAAAARLSLDDHDGKEMNHETTKAVTCS